VEIVGEALLDCEIEILLLSDTEKVGVSLLDGVTAGVTDIEEVSLIVGETETDIGDMLIVAVSEIEELSLTVADMEIEAESKIVGETLIDAVSEIV